MTRYSDDDGNDFVEFGGATIHSETSKATLVSLTGNEDDAQWLPKSQFRSRPTEDEQGDPGTVRFGIRKWLANKVGWVAE